MTIPNEKLIDIAIGVLNPYLIGSRLFGDFGAALISGNGDIYTGVSVDTPSWGLCAERSAKAAMITARQYKVLKVVAVWRDERSGKVQVLPPCGVCREFMRNVDMENLEAEVLLGRLKSVKLKDLLPFHEWPNPLRED